VNDISQGTLTVLAKKKDDDNVDSTMVANTGSDEGSPGWIKFAVIGAVGAVFIAVLGRNSEANLSMNF
jgi:hypothetical protein